MIFCGLDLETSDIPVGSARILEVACVLYDSESASLFERWSALVWCNSYATPNQAALNVNGLSVKTLESVGAPPKDIFPKVIRYIERADAVIAHNGNSFDKPILEFELEQAGFKAPDRPWIDSRYDLPYPSSSKSRKLSHLAVDHNIPFIETHRALKDVEIMLQIASKYDLLEAYNRAKTPLLRIEAQLAYKDREEAKTRGYTWDNDKKLWFKNIREFDYQKEIDNSPFVVFKCLDTNEKQSREKISKQDPPAT